MSREKQIEEMTRDMCDSCREAVTAEECRLNCCDGVRQHAEALYAKGYRKQSEWISVEDRLPKQWKYVLVCCGDEIRTDFIASDGRWYEHIHDIVTHWMPLPEAPKKGGE